MQTASSNALEWEGGSIDDLIHMLAAPALAVRVEVRTPAAGKPRKVGEIHMVAGGVQETIAGELRGDDAMEQLRGVSPLSFRLQPRLPNPDDGGLLIPGPGEGTLAERPPAELMRYCELYVLTCVLEMWRDTDRASIEYQKGDIGKTIVNGSESSDRLAEVINWDSGGYRIVLPDLSLPEPPRPVQRTAPQPAKTMFGYPAATVTAPPSQPVAVQTASVHARAPQAAPAEAPRPTPVKTAPGVAPEPAPVASPPPRIVAREPKSESKPASVQLPVEAAPGAAPPSPAPAKVESKPVDDRKPEAAPAKEAPPPDPRKTESRKTESRKAKKSKPPEKRTDDKRIEGAAPAPMVAAPPREGSMWSAIGLGLVVGLALAGVYWLIRAVGN